MVATKNKLIPLNSGINGSLGNKIGYPISWD